MLGSHFPFRLLYPKSDRYCKQAIQYAGLHLMLVYISVQAIFISE